MEGSTPAITNASVPTANVPMASTAARAFHRVSWVTGTTGDLFRRWS
ncbi:MAG TPA: hypothetical protein VK735_26470 [Pseudonocardia sp.]|nr:hypothetical protein [Pseudonocardia sp.]